MKNSLQILATAALMLVANLSFAQRYQTEVFTDAEITVTSDVTYATNINFLTSDFTPTAQLQTDLGTLSLLADGGNPYPANYYDPGDVSTQVKVTDIKMDVYHPDNTIDTETERPVMVYIHTGNFLPPPINGSMMGTKTDSLAVDLCRSWARRGYVAISVNYRLGWNPIGDEDTRRSTLLNAVYRALQDSKMAVRSIRDNAATYGADVNKIALFGEGSGGYISQAYTTLDNASVELFITKFLPDEFDPTTSYVDTLLVGLPSGFGYQNSLNLYRASATSAEVQMSINAGGALADESWLEAGDVPMVAFHAIRDNFAPFTAGTVIVPTTQEDVVDVHGSNFFIQKANDLGNNDVFASLPDGDVYTDRARSLYNQSFDAVDPSPYTETVNATPEGLFPIEQPLQPFLTNISAPWQWWDPSAPLSQVEVAPGVTTHMAQLQSNPNMSEAQSLAYQDTINGFLLPRLTCALDLPGNPCSVVECPSPGAVICDNIDDYTLGAMNGQGAHWDTWSGTLGGAEDAIVSDEQAFSNSQSVLIQDGGSQDVLLRLGDQESGQWTLDWKMYIPVGNNGYYNFQGANNPGDAFIAEVYFNQTNGTPGEGTWGGTAFTYPEGAWFDVQHAINLDTDEIDVTINGAVVGTFPYTVAGGDLLSSIDFFSADATNNRYYIDDVIYDGEPGATTCDVVGALICDNIDDYTLGAMNGQGAHWDTWSGTLGGAEDAIVSDEQAFSNSQSVLIQDGGSQDVLLRLGDYSTGQWTLDWKMYIPVGNNGYYNFQGDPTPGTAFIAEVYFNQTNGTPGEGTWAGTAFTYPEGAWFDVQHAINLNTDEIIVTINGTEVGMFPYTVAGGDLLSAIDFFSADATNNRYYIDDVVLLGAPDGILEFTESVFTVYPNPTEDMLTIAGDEQIDAVIVRDVLGAIVRQLDTPYSNNVTIDLADLTDGVYFVEVRVGDVANVSRVIKR